MDDSMPAPPKRSCSPSSWNGEPGFKRIKSVVEYRVSPPADEDEKTPPKAGAKLFTELYDLILNYVADDDEKGAITLASAAQCNKKFQDIANRLLYPNVFLNFKRYYHDLERAPGKQGLPGLMANMKSWTKELTVLAPVGSDAEDVLQYVISKLPLVSLTKLDIGRVPASDLTCSRLVEIMTRPTDKSLVSFLSSITLPLAQPTITTSSEVLDSWVTYIFQPTNLKRTQPITVFGGGYKAHADEDENTKGTPTTLIGSVVQAFGTGEGFKHLKWMKKWLEHPCIDVLKVAQLGPPLADPVRVTSLTLSQHDFQNAFPQSAYEALEFSSIERLRLDCVHLPSFFVHLLPSKLRIKTFEVDDWTWDEPQRMDEQSNIECLLKSFSGLEHMIIVTLHGWQPDVHNVLSNHGTLKTLALSFGKTSMTKAALKKVRSYCPSLTSLGFRHKMFELPFKHGGFVGREVKSNGKGKGSQHIKGFDEWIKPLPEKFAEFRELTEFKAYLEPTPCDKFTHGNVKMTKETIDDGAVYDMTVTRMFHHLRIAKAKVDPNRNTKVTKISLHDKALYNEFAGIEEGGDGGLYQKDFEREYKLQDDRGVEMRMVQ